MVSSGWYFFTQNSVIFLDEFRTRIRLYTKYVIVPLFSGVGYHKEKL
jgi:hypothetical protein